MAGGYSRALTLTLYVLSIIIVLGLVLAYSGITQNITGFLPFDEQNIPYVQISYTDILNLDITGPSEIEWKPENSCASEDCLIGSIRISGEATAGEPGNLRIYLERNGDRYLLLSKEFNLERISQNESNYIQTNSTVTNMTNENETNETSSNITFQENLSSNESNVTVNETIVSWVAETFYFTDSCVNTCDINESFSENSMQIVFEMTPNITAKIYNISYVLLHAAPETNQEQQTIPSPPAVTPEQATETEQPPEKKPEERAERKRLTQVIEAEDFKSYKVEKNKNAEVLVQQLYPETEGFSAEAWIKTSDINDATILSSGECCGIEKYWAMAKSWSVDRAFLLIKLNDETGEISGIGNTNIADGFWHHVVFVRDNAGRRVKGYVDGGLETEFEDTTEDVIDFSDKLLIGTGNIYQEEWFVGDIAGVQTFDKALEEAEAKGLYEDGLKRFI